MKTALLATPGENGISRLSVEEITLAPDEESGELSYSQEETFYFVVTGYGLLKSDVYGYALEPQVGVYVPPSTPHDVRNTGATDCVMLRYRALGAR